MYMYIISTLYMARDCNHPLSDKGTVKFNVLKFLISET